MSICKLICDKIAQIEELFLYAESLDCKEVYVG